MNHKTVLFLPSNANHVRIFEPISKSLEQQYEILYVSPGLYKDEGAENELKSCNIAFKKFNDYAKQDPQFIINSENVSLIVVGNDTDVIPQWFINIAHKMEIPTILIQDGLLFDVKPLNNSFSYRLNSLIHNPSKKLLKLALRLKISKQFKKISYGQGGCSQIHVWGNLTKNYLLKKRIPENSIHISGNPKFQNFSTKNNIIFNEEKNPLILYAPTELIQTGIMDKNNVSKMVHDICESVTSINNSKLIIKPHPIENTKFYNSFQKKYGQRIEIVNEDIGSLITKSDIVITNLSTVSMEALQKRKPVVIFLPKIEKIVNPNSFPLDLIEKGVFLYAKDKQDLTEKIDNISKNGFEFSSSKLQIISDYLGVQENAVSNIVNSIEEILKK